MLTVLAAFAVWWGLRPLLTSPFTAPPGKEVVAPSPVVPSPSVTPSPSRSVAPPRSVAPKPSLYDGWAFANGAFVRTFEVNGGTATVRIVDGHVSLVSSAPWEGYTITSRQPGPDRLVLEFFKPGEHYTVVDAMWWQNRPYAEVNNVA
ncbi:MAG TPA: hypothetical protein DGT23_20570 [Micromonosporaceae bacterium]|nr:hypothetical protein [Micromonosporaceae bacterium]